VSDGTPTRATHIAFVLLSSCVVAFEILVTRVVSVRFGNHLSFAVISLAMFGLTVGALLVHVADRVLHGSPERITRWLAISTVAAAVAVPAVFAALATAKGQMGAELWQPHIIYVYVVTAVPFICAGVAICLLLTHFRGVPGLYAADLIGAGLAGIGFVLLMKGFHPGPASCLLGAILLGSAAAFLGGSRKGAAAALGAAGVALAIVATVERQGSAWFPSLVGEKLPMIAERWNAFSRVSVSPHGPIPFGWGRHPACSASTRVEQKMLFIDRTGGTPLTRWNGDVATLDFLSCDVTYAANAIATGRDALVVGLGGGRDVLASLHGGHRHVTAVEINPLVLELLAGPFRELTGNLIDHPKVTVVNDEARSFVTRNRDRFGLIQVSMVDTFAASASGAFALTENSLYTVEAFVEFLEHLTDDGVLSVSRWHYYEDDPFETLRTMALARAALERLGVAEPHRHIMVAAGGRWELLGPRGTATVLTRRTAFTPEEVQQLVTWTKQRGLVVVYAPGTDSHPLAAGLATAPDLEVFAAAQAMDIAPPTDDQPFFFLMRPRDDAAEAAHRSAPLYAGGLHVLDSLLLVTVLLSVLVIVVPAVATQKLQIVRARVNLAGAGFFLAIGVAFMLVEIAQMQRLTLLLGYPTLGLTVVLSTLLVSSGVGSFVIGRIVAGSGVSRRLIAALGLALLVVLAGTSVATAPLVKAFAGAALGIRILIAVLTLAPAGLVMGMMFPLGMEIARKRPDAPAAWFWALNGSASVVASILAVVISTRFGIQTLLLSGALAYGAAVLLLGALQHLSRSATS
jgi:predicted membrane-bound spermidine synthase